MQNADSTEPGTIQDELIRSVRHKIDEATQQFIGAFEQSAKEVKAVMESEFSRKPWLYVTSLIGAGVVIGYFVGRSELKSVNE